MNKNASCKTYPVYLMVYILKTSYNYLSIIV